MMDSPAFGDQTQPEEESGNRFLRCVPALTTRVMSLLEYIANNGRTSSARPESSRVEMIRDLTSGFPHIITYMEEDEAQDAELHNCGVGEKPIVEEEVPFLLHSAEQLWSTEDIQEAFFTYFFEPTLKEQLISTSCEGSSDTLGNRYEEPARQQAEHRGRRSAATEMRMLAEEEVRYFLSCFFVEAQRCVFDVLQVLDGDVTTGLSRYADSGVANGSDIATHNERGELYTDGFSSDPLGAESGAIGVERYDISRRAASHSDAEQNPAVLQKRDERQVAQQEASAALQFVISVAYSCPSTLMAAAAQLVLSDVISKRYQLRRQMSRSFFTRPEQEAPRDSDIRKTAIMRDACSVQPDFFRENKKQLALIRPWSFRANDDVYQAVLFHMREAVTGRSSRTLTPIAEGKEAAEPLANAAFRANMEVSKMQYFLSLDEMEQRNRIKHAGETMQLQLSACEEERAVMLTPHDRVLWVGADGKIVVQSLADALQEDAAASPFFIAKNAHRKVARRCFTAPRQSSCALPLLQYALSKSEEEAYHIIRQLLVLPLVNLCGHEMDRSASWVSRWLRIIKSLSGCDVVPRPQTRMTRREVLCSVFSECGECASYYSLLSCVSAPYLSAHHILQRFLLFQDGPLPIDIRLMIAVMTASRHRCAYLVQRFTSFFWLYTSRVGDREEEDFEGEGVEQDSYFSGNSSNTEHTKSALGSKGGTWRSSRESWIIDGPPPRLQCVQRWIDVAAREPWAISEMDIQECLDKNWTIPELFHLTVLVSGVLSLTSFALAMMVPSEAWSATVLPRALHQRMELSFRAFAAGRTSNNWYGRARQGEAPTPCGDSFAPPFHDCAWVEKDTERSSSVRSVTASGEGIDIFSLYSGGDSATECRNLKPSDWLWSSDFDWKETGSTFLEQYYPGVTALLLEEEDQWRHSIWRLSPSDCAGMYFPSVTPEFAFSSLHAYIMCILGYMKSDYRSQDVNKVLLRPAKAFAQQMAIKPEQMESVNALFCGLSEKLGAGDGDVATKLCGELMEGMLSVLLQRIGRENDLIDVEDGQQNVDGGFPAHGGAATPLTAKEMLKWVCSEMGKEPPSASIACTGDEVSGASIVCALSLQHEKLMLLIATTTMMARRDAILHLFLYCLSSFLHKL